MAAITGRFILSVNDVPETRAIFSRFSIRTADVFYSFGSAAPARFGELIIRNV